MGLYWYHNLVLVIIVFSIVIGGWDYNPQCTSWNPVRWSRTDCLSPRGTENVKPTPVPRTWRWASPNHPNWMTMLVLKLKLMILGIPRFKIIYIIYTYIYIHNTHIRYIALRSNGMWQSTRIGLRENLLYRSNHHISQLCVASEVPFN